MKKILTVSIIIASIVCSSCGSDKTKTEATDTIQKTSADTVLPRPEEELKKNEPTKSATSKKSSVDPGKNAILANIDRYLVSTVAYPDPGTVVIKNTLPNITVQKAIIEVIILNANNVTVRLDYYIVNNIEPGENKTVKITGAASGVSASSRIVKLNSNELTAGETIMVGSKLPPKY